MTCIKRPHSVWTTCTCDDCLIVRRRLNKLAANGAYHRVSSEEAWARLDRMIAMDWSTHAVASATGISAHTMQAVLSGARNGRRQTFGPTHAALIVNAGRPTRGTVGATGTRRRIQALSALGHTLGTIAEHSGISIMSACVIRSQKTRTATPGTVVKVAMAYDRLEMVPGTSAAARVYAKREGWPPPLGWDGDIDDPQTEPWRPTARVRAGRPDRDIPAEYLHLSGLGESFEQIAAQLGLQPQSLQRTLERYGVGA